MINILAPAASFETAASRLPQDEESRAWSDGLHLMLRSAFRARLEACGGLA
jgi:hypothetical protein